jgi:hypothetical protein
MSGIIVGGSSLPKEEFAGVFRFDDTARQK